MSLRSLGRWLYHAITSSDKRPYIESSLEELEDLADESSSASEAFRMLGIFDELTYRITSPERRDRLKTRITNQLLQMEGIRLPISSDREKVSEIRAQLLSRYVEKTDSESKAIKEAAAEKARLEAEAKAQREAEEKAPKESERKAKEDAASGNRRERELQKTLYFTHSKFTRQLCPEAKGHFCMLWGEHGHGGYDTQTNGYIQGGQPMDESFDWMSIYLDFDEGQNQRNWGQMRRAVSELRQLRSKFGYSQSEERSARRE